MKMLPAHLNTHPCASFRRFYEHVTSSVGEFVCMRGYYSTANIPAIQAKFKFFKLRYPLSLLIYGIS